MTERKKPPRGEEAGTAGGSTLSEEERVAAGLSRRRDPGDAVPEGVAPEEPAPLTPEDRKAKKRLEELPKRR